MPLRIRLGVWHESETEAKKLKSGCFSRPSASDQAIQSVCEVQLRVCQESARHIKTQHYVVGGRFLILSCHFVIRQQQM